MKNSIFIWGSKSYARIVNDFIENYKRELNLDYFTTSKKNRLKIKYFFDPYSKKIDFSHNAIFSNNFSQLAENIKNCKFFLVCVGNHYGILRTFISQQLENQGLTPLTLVSNKSNINNSTYIGKGVVVMPNSYINAFSNIGDYTIINSGSNIEHETNVGVGVHIMSGACLSGRNKIGNFVTIGTNATILPDVIINDGAYIGAGSVITKNVKKNEIIIGNPGRFLKKNNYKIEPSFTKKLKNILRT